MEKKKAKSITIEQKQMLKDFIHNNPKLLAGKFGPSFTLKDGESMWKSISKELNKLKGCIKNWEDWRKASESNDILGEEETENYNEEDNNEEDMRIAETYADYMPAKLKLGKKHPDPVVETASLSSIEPADVNYELSLPLDIINSGSLSALQLEAITYTCQQHNHILPDGSRAGFLIGDGAGVGKGRTIAGLIFENFLKGYKKAIWVSVSNDLKLDAERDLKDIGASKIKVYSLNKFKYEKIDCPKNGNVSEGVIFSTYSALLGKSSVGGKYKSRFDQLLNWCGDDYNGVIVFDECHRAKNLCSVGSSKSTRTGLAVLELQNKLPNARVVYASATGASEPRHMAYMVRLGLWGQGTTFPNLCDFIKAVEKRGVSAMEIVAMDMKRRGMYIARQLSFLGVSFKIDEVQLSPAFIDVYNDSVKLWVDALHMFEEAGEYLYGDDLNLIKRRNRFSFDKNTNSVMWCQFWSSHQRFFKYLCIAAKVNYAVDVAKEAVKNGKCVIIGLQSTGEAKTLEQLEKDDGELNDFVSTAKGVLEALVEKHFPQPDSKKIKELFGQNFIELINSKTKIQSQEISSSRESGVKRKNGNHASSQSVKRCKDSSSSSISKSDNKDSNSKCEISKEHSDDSEIKKNEVPSKIELEKEKMIHLYSMKKELIERVEMLGEKLPPNTLDQLIDKLGGPTVVAEMTGRRGRVVQTDGEVQYETRSEVNASLEMLNVTEKQRFMDGEKLIAIISEAASSGISLQSDRRARNKRRRVHITLELPWSADRAIQQFGRSHRSNQVSAPEYIFLISDLAGERRFASTVAKRLENLGALTHGDRRATDTRDLSKFNFDNKYGRAALKITINSVMGTQRPIIPPPDDYEGNFFKDVIEALKGVGLLEYNRFCSNQLLHVNREHNMGMFLNRILGMPVELQNRLFNYFTDVLQHYIIEAKKSGRFDLGIMDLGASGENVKHIKMYKFLRKHATGHAVTELHIVHVERGMSWDEAVKKSVDVKSSYEGFYLSHHIKNNKITPVLALIANNSSNKKSDKKDILFNLFRPNIGLQAKLESLNGLQNKYYKVKTDEAKQPWEELYDTSKTICSHAYWNGNCRMVTFGRDCEVGLRHRAYAILSGSMLTLWGKIETIVKACTGYEHKMQIIRLQTAEEIKVVGILIPKSCVEALEQDLRADSEKTEEHVYD